MNLPIILGTARKERQSEKVANFILKEVIKNNIESEIIDVRDFLFGFTENKEQSELTKILSEKINKADGLIIVSPEYNHSFPGELKIMLDALYKQYFYKPLGICGVSAGSLGGARMVEQLRLVSVEYHMIPIREAVYFSNVNSLFSAEGEITDASYVDRLKVLMSELTWYAESLKQPRETKLNN